MPLTPEDRDSYAHAETTDLLYYLTQQRAHSTEGEVTAVMRQEVQGCAALPHTEQLTEGTFTIGTHERVRRSGSKDNPLFQCEMCEAQAYDTTDDFGQKGTFPNCKAYAERPRNFC